MSMESHATLTLNMAFKNKLVKLKATLSREFDIQLPIDKLIHDQVYRLGVFDELLSLGNEQVTAQVKSLQSTVIYQGIESVNNASEAHHLTENGNRQGLQYAKQGQQNKVNKSSFLIMLLASVIFIFIILLQTNIIQVRIVKEVSEPTLAISPQVNQANLNPVFSAASKGPLQPSSHASHLSQTHAANAHAKDPILPLQSAPLSMRLHGSNTIGEDLAPILITAYLKAIGVTDMAWIKGDSGLQRQLQYIHNHRAYAIELQAHGTATAFKGLANKTADIATASRKINHAEVDMLRSQYGNLGLSSSERIISLDGLAIIVHQGNPVQSLTLLQLAQIFSGDINNWKQVGGKDLIIQLYARDSKSGTWYSFKQLVLNSYQKILAANVSRYESSSKLSNLVARDEAGIGFIGLSYINKSKVLAIAASSVAAPIYPNQFTISTEDYPLTRRLYLYVPDASSDFIKGFADYVTSAAGQRLVEQVGLVSQNIQRQHIYPIAGVPQIYNDYGEIAQRLSLNFRFQKDSDQLDSKGQQDLLRLVSYIRQHNGLRIVLMGFSDSSEEQGKYNQLSLIRAQIVEKALVARGLNITSVEGLGSKIPIASTTTALGRSKNRRVEVWVF